MNAKFTIKDLEQLQAAGKIKGFTGKIAVKKNAKRKLTDAELALRKLGSKNKQWMYLQLKAFAESNNLILSTEFQFHHLRKFKSDFALNNTERTVKILIEYEGIVSFNGHHNGHTSMSGYTKDSEKYNLAQANEYIVLRYTTNNCKSLISDLIKIIHARQ